MNSQPATTPTFADALAAHGPAPPHAAKLMLFGQFVGHWLFDAVDYGGSGEVHAAGEWRFAWIVGGNAVQDVRNWGGRKTTTLRYYDPTADLWSVAWVDPAQHRSEGPTHNNLCTLIGREWPGGILMEGRTAEERPVRWSFADISDDFFRSRAEVWDETELHWRLTEEAFVRRV
jgi:hypothetical protein